MFRKHPLRDFMLFLIVGMTLTFAFTAQGVDTNKANNTRSAIYTQ